MKSLKGAIAAAALISASALGVAACGGDDDDEGGGGGGDTRKGGEISIGTVGPDNYDPALFQTLQAAQALQLVYTPLTTYAHEEGRAGGEVIPGLAEELPTVTNGGRNYAFKLRQGLTYSDGTPVRASDFEHAMKRLIGQEGPYSSFFTGIVGAADYQEKGNDEADIPGIEANDRTGEIRIELEAPDGQFPYAMGQPYAAPVPASKAPIRSMTNDPPPGVGPYTIDVIDPKRRFVLTKNRRFNVPGLPEGNIDKITGVVSDSVPRMTQDVIDGKLDFMTEDPTGDQLPEVRQKYRDRFREDANPPNTYYFFLNVSVPPFDKLEARQAVNYAIDSNALVRIFGGRLEPGCTFLPPAVEGFKDYECPYGDPNEPGNVARARELVEESGTKGQTVTVWTNNKDPRPAIAQYYADVLSDIGYRTKVRTLDQQVYFDRVGTKSTKAQTGFTNWFQDFPHPADFFQPNLSGEALQSTPTGNQGFVNDRELDERIDELTQEPDLGKVKDEWGELDELVVGPRKAYLVPYGYEKATSFFSERMGFEDCAGVHAVWKNDWTQFCLK